MKSFKINFKDIPTLLLKEKEGELVLTLDIPSLNGRKRFYLKGQLPSAKPDGLKGVAMPTVKLTRETGRLEWPR